ncbi:MAG: hypothetical protein KDE31_37220, partial [Caldilineaceae bacterium]|nr:hypothetical protein [Caldilineaceae bacterium]
MIQILPIAFVSGGLAAGIKLYRRSQRARVQRHPWLIPDQARVEMEKSPASPLTTIKATLKKADDSYQSYVRAQIDPLFGAARMQQMEELGLHGERIVLSSTEKQLNRNIAISIVVVATAVAAGQAMLPIVLICFPLALDISRPILQRAHHSVVHERRLTTSVVAAVNAIATWVGGFYVAGGLGFVLYYLAEKLIYITEDNSRQRLANIFDQQPRSVWVLINGVEVEIPFAQLQVGNTMVIGAGQMIPVDCVITNGYGAIDQHRLTGEAQPVEKTVGDQVLAATVMLAGKIDVQVEKAGK